MNVINFTCLFRIKLKLQHLKNVLPTLLRISTSLGFFRSFPSPGQADFTIEDGYGELIVTSIDYTGTESGFMFNGIGMPAIIQKFS